MKTIQTTSSPILKDLKITLPSLKSLLINISILTLLFHSFVSLYLFWAAITALAITASHFAYKLYVEINSISFDDVDFSVKLEDIINDLENR